MDAVRLCISAALREIKIRLSVLNSILSLFKLIFAIQNFEGYYEGHEVWRYIRWQTRTDAPYCESYYITEGANDRGAFCIVRNHQFTR
jgi:hypothetical protein